MGLGEVGVVRQDRRDCIGLDGGSRIRFDEQVD